MAPNLKITRDQLAVFLKDHQAIKQFENIFVQVSTTLPAEILGALEIAIEARALARTARTIAELNGGAGISGQRDATVQQSGVLLWLSM